MQEIQNPNSSVVTRIHETSFDSCDRISFVLRIIKNFSSQLKLPYSYFLLFIFISLVRASSGDSVILFSSDKDSFIDWIISRKINKLGIKLQVKSDLMLVINSYTINQLDSYFDNLKISIWQLFWPYDRLLLVMFNKINFQHLTCS